MAEGVHLQNVVHQAYQRPFAAHLLQPAEEKHFRDLRRRIEYLESQRREQIPAQAYLYWIDGGDGNDPWMASAPTEKNGTAATPAPSPESRLPPGERRQAQIDSRARRAGLPNNAKRIRVGVDWPGGVGVHRDWARRRQLRFRSGQQQGTGLLELFAMFA